jgi:hypothetical protein
MLPVKPQGEELCPACEANEIADLKRALAAKEKAQRFNEDEMTETIASLKRKLAEARLDSERLTWLARFFRVDDVGDDAMCPGMIVDTDAVSEAFDYGPLENEILTGMDGWIHPDMRRVIDKAMSAPGGEVKK